MTKKAFILASASPRRLQLLQQVGIYPDEVLPANIDEVQYKGENIVRYVQRMALEKAQSVAICRPGSVVLGADTIVVAGRRILPKAEDEETARECLRILSGRRHQVYTAVCVIHEGRVQQALEVTRVRFDRLVQKDIEDYLKSREWEGKAGGYAIQGLAERFIPWINGSFSNVVGLPLSKTCNLLKQSRVQ